MTPEPAERIVCASCGTTPGTAAARLAWTVGTERGRTVWTCVDCSRRYLRGIEAKLDSDWW